MSLRGFYYVDLILPEADMLRLHSVAEACNQSVTGFCVVAMRDWLHTEAGQSFRVTDIKCFRPVKLTPLARGARGGDLCQRPVRYPRRWEVAITRAAIMRRVNTRDLTRLTVLAAILRQEARQTHPAPAPCPSGASA